MGEAIFLLSSIQLILLASGSPIAAQQIILRCTIRLTRYKIEQPRER